MVVCCVTVALFNNRKGEEVMQEDPPPAGESDNHLSEGITGRGSDNYREEMSEDGLF